MADNVPSWNWVWRVGLGLIGWGWAFAPSVGLASPPSGQTAANQPASRPAREPASRPVLRPGTTRPDPADPRRGPATPSPAEQRKVALSEALLRPDRRSLAALLDDVGQLHVWYSRRAPLGKEDELVDQPAIRYTAAAYLGGHQICQVLLARDAPGDPPEDWLKVLAVPPSQGFKPFEMEWMVVLNAQAAGERDRLLAEADAKIRAGLADLARQFPQLTRTNSGELAESLAGRSPPGRISLYVARIGIEPGGGGQLPPPGQDYQVAIRLYPLRLDFGEHDEPRERAVFERAGLGGRVSVMATDKRLDAALKKLVNDALAPLWRVNEPSSMPAPGDEPTRHPAGPATRPDSTR